MIRNESSIVEMMSGTQRDLEELKQTQTGGGAIPDGSITTTKLADGAVTSAKLGSNAVTSGKINSNAVTSGKINNGAITTDKLADANVTDAKLAHDADFSSEVLIGKFGNEYLYKLIFTGTSGSAVNTWTVLSTTISMTNFVRLVSIKGVIHGGGTTEYYPMNADSANFIVYFTNGTFSERHSASYYNSRAITVEVEFTRSA